jgi:NAD(P)-dependent dehydrogenase (short-subunit alcohol dehydrogenase family)
MAKIWFITGAGRGLGADIAQAALRAGDRVVAAARKRSAVNEKPGPDNDRLLSVELDVTDAAQAQKAVDAAVARFGGIDVLVNNAGYGQLGYFEEVSVEDLNRQFATNVFGVFNVTRATLPVMRAAKRGRIFNLSSLAGIRGSEFTSLYNATKFALEGFSEGLARELAPLGIFVTVVSPGPFRTDFLTPESLRFGSRNIKEYDERRTKVQATFVDRNGRQPGDPVKLAEAFVRLAAEPKPPLRFVAGKFAVETTEAKLTAARAELDEWRTFSLSLDY